MAGKSVCNLSRRDTLKLLSAAAFAPTIAGSQDLSANSSELLGQLRIGTEFFLNRSETRDGIQRHFRLMHDSGLTLVRIFVIWDDIEHTPGIWNFERYDSIYDAAAANGIKIVTTLCAEDPPGWTGQTPFYHNRTNLNEPEVRKHAADYIRRVVNRYRSHTAQGVWLLMNEPSKYDTEPATLLAFGEWLRQKYGKLEKLNATWFRQLKSFSDVTITSEMLKGGNYGWLDYSPIIDWREFNIDNLVNQLLWIKSQVLLYDTNHLTHLNVTAPLGGPVGQDVWKEQKVVEILGASIHPAWVFPPSTPHEQYGELFAYRLDLIGGPSGTKPWWLTELQSGPTVFTGGFPLNPSPADLTRWLWDSFGAGSRGVIFWLWQPREGGQEGGEWGLVSVDGHPSIRLPAVKAVADSLRKVASLADAHPQEPRAAILYNRETAILDNLEGSRFQHRGDEWEQSIQGCYYALRRAHIPVMFVDIGQLKDGAVNGFDVLYAPYSYALDQEGVRALHAFVNQSGTLWADGLTAWKNAMGHIRPYIPGNLADLFGVRAYDIYPVKVDQPYSVTPANELAGELWQLPLELNGAETLITDMQGKPFATRNRFGKGQAIYFQSALTLAYFKRNNQQIQQWIVEPAKDAAAKLPVTLTRGSRQIAFRALVHKSGAFAVLSNWGRTEQIVVSFRGDHQITNALTGEPVQVSRQNGASLASLTLSADEVAVLEAT
jgi:beta-galactosidase